MDSESRQPRYLREWIGPAFNALAFLFFCPFDVLPAFCVTAITDKGHGDAVFCDHSSFELLNQCAAKSAVPLWGIHGLVNRRECLRSQIIKANRKPCYVRATTLSLAFTNCGETEELNCVAN